ncbi:MAG TPA: hypothetical protein VG056_11170 [Pirellulales bacterium]|nr:hypothetical protein [Pirellulales bacterium]
MNGWHFNPVGGYAPVVGVAALFLVLLMLASPDLRKLAGRRRNTLIILRVAVFLAVIGGMVRPTYVFTTMKRHRATLIVLVDRSRSMSVADEINGATRWQRLRDEVDKALPAFRDLNDDLDVKFYTFDSDLAPVDVMDRKFDLGAAADGPQTAIGAAMSDALHKETGHRLAGVVLLSDGGQNALEPRDAAPQTSARQLGDMGVPLFTITFGQETSQSQRRDVAVTALDVNPTVFVKNELIIGGTVRISGYQDKDIPIQALYEVEPGKPPQVIGTKIVRAAKDGEELPVKFSYIPQTVGEHKVTLRVDPQEKEQDTTNNEQSTIVKVFEGGLNVKYIEGEARIEQRFLRRSLNASPDIKVDFEFVDHLNRKKWPIDFSDAFKHGRYDVYILGDIDSAAFRPEDLKSLREAVEHGAGLIMLGGFHSFWAGGYQNTELREILPIEAGELDKFDRQNFDEPIREKLHLVPTDREQGLKMVPSRPFGDISIMQLDTPEKNRAVWLKLPGLDGANLFRALKPTARPLAVTSPGGQPLLVAAEAGAGRVLAFAGDSTWHWYMEGFEKEHKKFWRQVVFWLAKKDEAEKTGVWIKLAQRQFTPRRPVEFTVGATSPQGDPIRDATFEASAILPDGSTRPLHLARQGEQTTGSFKETQLPGDYTVLLTATRGGAKLGEAKGRFIVYDQDLEMENPAPRPSLMKSLAAYTKDAGGATWAPEELTDLCGWFKKQTKDLEVPTEIKETPWDKPYYFLIVVALLSAEWFLRKKWGLV